MHALQAPRRGRVILGPSHASSAAVEAGVPLTAEELAVRERSNYLMGGALAAMAGYGYYVVTTAQREGGAPPPSAEHLVNWSGTHECQVARFYQPESLEQLEATVKQAHKAGGWVGGWG